MSEKKCLSCNVVKNLSEFHRLGDGHRPRCKECRKSTKQTTWKKYGFCSLCGFEIYKRNGRCRSCYLLERKNSPKWRVDKHGYVVAGKGRSQHREVMELSLGRKLYPHESVHHKNGIKSDNTLSNLELWSVSQPAGQRVEDKIRWAKKFLAEYDSR